MERTEIQKMMHEGKFPKEISDGPLEHAAEKFEEDSLPNLKDSGNFKIPKRNKFLFG